MSKVVADARDWGRVGSSASGVRLCLAALAEEAEELGLPVTARLIEAAMRAAAEEAAPSMAGPPIRSRALLAS